MDVDNLPFSKEKTSLAKSQLIFLVAIASLILPGGCFAFEKTSIRPTPKAIVPEPVVFVEKYRPQDWRHDPEIYYSVPNERNVESESPIKSPSYKSPLSTIQQLDRKIRSLKYDPSLKTIGESKASAQVVSSGSGNCFEVARLAMEILSHQGYNAHVIDVKIGSMKDWHSICIFQELDGTWSMFSATDRFIGYSSVHASSVEDLVKSQFPTIKDVMFLR